MKRVTEDWVFFADKDILMAKNAIGIADLTGGVSFHCQQAIEKYFKAYLAEHGKKNRKTHDLINLYYEVKTIQDWNLDEALLKIISDIYIETRYPENIGLNPNGAMPSTEDAQRYLEFALHIEHIFKSIVP